MLTKKEENGKRRKPGRKRPEAADGGFYGLVGSVLEDPGTDKGEAARSDRAREREKEILEAATRVFADKGYDGSRTREIAREAGISEALMFRYFPSKNALLMAVVKPFIERFAKPVFLKPARKMLEEHAEDPVETVLQEVMRDRLKLFRGNQRLILTLITEAVRRPELLEVVRRQIVPEIVSLANMAIGPARKRGELRDLDDGLLVRSFLSLVVGYIGLTNLAPDAFMRGREENDIVDIVDLFLNGAKEKKHG